MSRRKVSIPCGTIVLEGILEIPESGQMPTQGAVICHPHPLYGGNMNNNVAKALADGLFGRTTVCLRFNFRGTGQSQGTYGQGNDEVDDVRAAMDYLQRLEEVDAKKIIVAGYSFGCWVGLRAASEDARPGRLIGISPPVDEYDFSFLKNEKRPVLLIAGDRDFVCSHEKFLELVESIPEPKSGVTLSGADHFHIGREKQLVGHVNAFLDEHPWTG